MGSGAVIYVPSSIKIGSGVQKLLGGGYTDTQGQQRDLISLLCFSQNKESRLNIPPIVLCVVCVFPNRC
jgi:hypothetical protein